MKCLPARSLMILNKHSTSSIEDAWGCSGVFWVCRTYSWLSMLVVSAITVSRVNPSTPPVGLYHTVWYFRDCYGLSPLKTIYKDFVHFHFQFEVDFTFNDIKVKNVWKITSIQKIVMLWCKMYIISEKMISTFCPCFHHLLFLLEEA